MSAKYCGMSPNAPPKALARFLTEREVDDFINPRYRACTRLSVRLMGPPRFITKRIGLALFAGEIQGKDLNCSWVGSLAVPI